MMINLPKSLESEGLPYHKIKEGVLYKTQTSSIGKHLQIGDLVIRVYQANVLANPYSVFVNLTQNRFIPTVSLTTGETFVEAKGLQVTIDSE